MSEQRQTLRSGKTLPLFTVDKLFDTDYMGALVAAVNALLSCQQIKFGDNNAAIQIPNAAGSGIAFRGEWLSGSGSITKRGDVWCVATGVNAGAYVALRDNPSGDPWGGGADWYKLPGPATLGQWM